MAQAPIAATAAAQIRQQGSLREYANQKLAPYLKQALKDSLDVDAEYPLQYLGEHLINQSLLYENNPDNTNIKEHFFYSFDKPTATTEEVVGATTEMAEATEAESIVKQEDVPTTNGQTHNDEQELPPEAATNEMLDGVVEAAATDDADMTGTNEAS